MDYRGLVARLRGYAPTNSYDAERKEAAAAIDSLLAKFADMELQRAHDRALLHDFARGLRNAIDELIAGRKPK